MACVDALRACGLVVHGMSFAQVVSMALRVLAESARDAGSIPTRTGTEFAELMAPWAEHNGPVQARKLALTKKLDERYLTSDEANVPSIAAPTAPAPLARRLEELRFRKASDPMNWTPADQAMLEDLAFQAVSEQG